MIDRKRQRCTLPPPLLYNEVRNLCSNFPLTDAFDLLLFIQIYTVKHYV